LPCGGGGLLSLRQGDLLRVLPLLEQAVSICQDADFPFWFPRMAAALGAAYTLAGRVADAVLLLTQAMEQTTATAMVGFQTLCHLSLGEAQVLAGRLEEAYALAERTLAPHPGAPGTRPPGICSAPPRRDRRASRSSRGEQAEAHYRHALALAEELGMRPLMAHCHCGLGMLYLKLDRAAQARPELSAAIALYRTMEMTFWLPQTEAALAQMNDAG
jgi:tetratricopeptide (TPR) repeat protein